jgi:serine/threonine protein kinase
MDAAFEIQKRACWNRKHEVLGGWMCKGHSGDGDFFPMFNAGCPHRAPLLDARTDLFSFGVTPYEMASGRLPFDRETTGATFGVLLHEGAELPTNWNPQLPPQLDEIIRKALEKDRNLRYVL